MGAPSKVRSGARALVYVVTNENPKGIPMGLVENWQLNQSHRVEAHTGVGSTSPDEMVYHGAGPVTVSWGRVRTLPAESLQAQKIMPEHRRVPFHEPVTVIVQDLDRGDVMWRITDCLPESFSVTIGSQTSIRENCSFMGKHLEHATELQN